MSPGKRIDAWDGLRFLFILGIVLFHSRAAFGHFGQDVLHGVYSLGGYFGNYFFFILSGILTERKFGPAMAREKVALGRFLAHRFLSVYIL